MIDNLAVMDVFRAWLLLLLIGTLYDRLVVDRIERLNPPIGVTAWEVVGGVTFTLVVFGLMLGPNRVTGFDAMLLLFILFSGSGLPMIVGSHNRHAQTT